MTKNARILSATVELDGKNIMVALCIEDVVDLITSIKTYDPARVISMDMGLHRFCDYSDGSGVYEKVENPGWIKKHEKRLSRLQRSMSRKRYDRTTHSGSKNWRKAQILVFREQRKIKNQRLDFHHKLSKAIADKCDVFICEDLNIRGMLKNRHLSKAISSVGWYQFLTFVKYKVEAHGGLFVKVSRWFPSSKLCTCCGYKNSDLELKDRYWICPSCYKFNDRDDNAVDNLRIEGLRILGEQGIVAIT